MAYEVDLQEIHFHLFEWLPIKEVLDAERVAEWDEESLRMDLGEELKISQEELGPDGHQPATSFTVFKESKATGIRTEPGLASKPASPSGDSHCEKNSRRCPKNYTAKSLKIA